MLSADDHAGRGLVGESRVEGEAETGEEPDRAIEVLDGQVDEDLRSHRFLQDQFGALRAKRLQLRLQCAAECRTPLAAPPIGVEGREAREQPVFHDLTEHGRHHQVASGEAALEMLLVAEPLGERLQALYDHGLRLRSPFLGPGLAGVEDVDRGELHGEGLDRVQGRDHPLRDPCPALRLHRRQRLGPTGDVQHDGAELEQLDLVVAVGGHLRKRLPTAVGLRILGVEIDQHRLVGDASLLERPADPQIAHIALGERRNPAKSRYLNSHGLPLMV